MSQASIYSSTTTQHPLDDAPAMRDKVEKDIAFLTDKIDRMMHQTRPNELLIEHYTGMLKSRQAVLSWLLDGEIASETSQVTKTA